MDQTYLVYIIENPEKRTYIGSSPTPEFRIKTHNHSTGQDWTQGKGPWKIIYTEKLSNKSDALKREKKLKSLKAGQRIKQILGIKDDSPCQGSSVG